MGNVNRLRIVLNLKTQRRLEFSSSLTKPAHKMKKVKGKIEERKRRNKLTFILYSFLNFLKNCILASTTMVIQQSRQIMIEKRFELIPILTLVPLYREDPVRTPSSMTRVIGLLLFILCSLA